MRWTVDRSWDVNCNCTAGICEGLDKDLRRGVAPQSGESQWVLSATERLLNDCRKRCYTACNRTRRTLTFIIDAWQRSNVSCKQADCCRKRHKNDIFVGMTRKTHKHDQNTIIEKQILIKQIRELYMKMMLKNRKMEIIIRD